MHVDRFMFQLYAMSYYYLHSAHRSGLQTSIKPPWSLSVFVRSTILYRHNISHLLVMHFSLPLSVAVLLSCTSFTLVAASPATRVGFAIPNNSADGTYVFDNTGAVVSFHPHTGGPALEHASVETRQGSLVKRDSLKCFGATMNVQDKLTALMALTALFGSNFTLFPGGSVATQFGKRACFSMHREYSYAVL